MVKFTFFLANHVCVGPAKMHVQYAQYKQVREFEHLIVQMEIDAHTIDDTTSTTI